MTDEQTTHGGPRPGAGHPHLDGSKPGEGEYLIKKSVTLPRWMVDYFTAIGDGVFSAGVRAAAEYHKERTVKYG